MKIIILGADLIGGSLARILAAEKNDIVLVDDDQKKLRQYEMSADLKTVVGFYSDPDVLVRADAENADMLVAVTDSDEVNMIACQVAHTLFNVPTKMAWVRREAYLKQATLFGDEGVPVDTFISPEQLVSDNICHLLQHPGSLQVVEFAEGRVLLVAVKAMRGARLVGKYLHDIKTELPDEQIRVVAIYRNGSQMVVPDGNTRIEVGDEVFFITAEISVRSITAAMHHLEKHYSRIFIAGGGRIGMHLARSLMQDYEVKLIDHNPNRTTMLSEQLDKVVVLQGDATDEEVMLEENMGDMDVFCAVTNDDEDNILSAMMAKHLGARKTIALINRPRYVDLIQKGRIDIVVSPQQASISALLKHIRKGDVVTVHSLRHGTAEAIEAVAHGDHRTSNVVGRNINNIRLPTGMAIAGLIRDEKLLINHDLSIESGDHVLLFVNNKDCIPEVERLFQVRATFF